MGLLATLCRFSGLINSVSRASIFSPLEKWREISSETLKAYMSCSWLLSTLPLEDIWHGICQEEEKKTGDVENV